MTGIVADGELVEIAGAGTRVLVLLDKTPFYAESGGQIGDRGIITAPGLKLEVEDVTKAPHGQSVHHALVVEGTLHKGGRVSGGGNLQLPRRYCQKPYRNPSAAQGA